MRLVVSPVGGRSAKLRVEKQDGNGNTVAVFSSSFADQSELAKGAKALGVRYDQLLDFIYNKYQKQQQTTLDLTAKPVGAVFNVRGERGQDSVQAASFADALATGKHGTVIEWSGTDAVCNLDVDLHGDYRPEPHDLVMFCETVRPAPSHFWLSRGGGLHLMYEASGNYTAEDLAAVGAFSLSLRFPLASFEFLSRTRFPPGKVHTRTPDAEAGIVRRLLGQYTEGDFTEWLEGKGLTGRERFPHTACPVNPYPAAHLNSDPVVVHADHVYCFICERDGVCSGCGTPGYFPLASLAGERSVSAVARCVSNLVHYGHAQFILAKHISSDSLSRRVYRALLKLTYGDDPRIPGVFAACNKNGLLRYDGYWCDNNGAMLALDKGSAILRTLPHCQYLDAVGEIEVDPEAVDYLSQNIDQTVRGYTPLEPVRGIQFTQFQDLPADKVYTVLHSAALAPESQASRRPKYVPRAADEKLNRRLSWEEAWSILDRVFPGIDRRLIELLLVGRGCVEHRAGLPPMLYLYGATGAGKTAHVHIAAAIAGDVMTAVPFTSQQDRLRQAVMGAKQEGAFLLFDEILKAARLARVTEVEAMETLLNFTSDSVSHALFIGPVKMGALPFLIWADSIIPLSILQHEQIGRRMHTYRLPGSVSWEGPMREAGVREPKELRASGSPEIIRACDAVLSEVIDRHFKSPVTDFAQEAAALGFQLMRCGSAVEEKYGLIRDLWHAVLHTPDADATQGKKWKRCKRVLPDPQDAIYLALEACWSEDERNSASVRMLAEADLARVLGLKQPVKFEIRRDDKRFRVRFANLDETKFNEELS